MFSKTKVKFYSGNPNINKICLTNEIHIASLAYNNKRRMKKSYWLTKKEDA